MKIVNKTLFFLSLIGLGLSNLEGKSIDIYFDHKVKETYHLSDDIPNLQQECLKSFDILSDYFEELKIENLGDCAIRNFFPSANTSPQFSLKKLAKDVGSKRYPLLALYTLWNRSIVCDESMIDGPAHPLDLLNFEGACSSAVSRQQFLRLCHSMGIETRLANIHGNKVYDFGVDGEWNFFDLANDQIILGLDNENLVSSEQIMDDPFLALRTKYSREADNVDFKESWKKLARFNIIESASSIPEEYKVEDLSHRSYGLDLYPNESLSFETSSFCPNLPSHQCAIVHTINFESRSVNHHWEHLSLFPINRLVNNSSSPVKLVNESVEIQPGQTYQFKQSVFQVSLVFSHKPKGKIVFSGISSSTLFPALVKGNNKIFLGTKNNESLIRFHYEIKDNLERKTLSAPRILNQGNAFEQSPTQFVLDIGKAEKIWWQISTDNQFQLVPSNLDQIENADTLVTLPLISETFLNPNTTYYFRVKGYQNGQWGYWSAPFSFKVIKPDAVDGVIFEEGANDQFELNWERYADHVDGSVEYLVFASNSLDFIPSIYCERQVNEIIDNEITEDESNDNLIAMTKNPKISVPGHFAYYRIIAKKDGQFSVPSRIIHCYDVDLIQPRNVLQVLDESSQFIAKRTLLPGSYPWSEDFLPRASPSAKVEQGLLKIQSILRSASISNKGVKDYGYELPKVSEEVWEEVRPYLLPDNHPAWPKLNRIFCKSRATLNSETFKKAGFIRNRPGTWSRVSASSNAYAPEYFIKAYCDVELGILYPHTKWIHRIKGAETIRACLKKYKLESSFKVPLKWIYPLPRRPSPPKSSAYIRKDFVLVCENMQILDHDANEKKYKYELSEKRMKGIYTILQVCGLYDSTYVFNIPFCKDGKIAIIDTEYHHKWPVPYDKLTKHFPKNLQLVWKKMTYKGGFISDGKSEYNPPRMDRRDIPLKK